MNNGDRKSGREIGFTTSSSGGSRSNFKNLRNEEFVRTIGKMAVAQVCESVGFHGFQQSALDTLADIAVRYVSHIGKSANNNANLAGRSECNVFDVIQGLEGLGMSQGFSGASKTHRCLAGSGVVKEIAEFVEIAEEIPFVYSVPRFTVMKERKPVLSFMQSGEMPPGEHVPMWLPVFPNPETYTFTRDGCEREGNGGMDKVVQVKDCRMVQGTVSSIHQPVNCNGSEMPISVDLGNGSTLKQAAIINPFLAPPFRFGEKEVSLIQKSLGTNVSSDKAEPKLEHSVNNRSVLEIYPAFDAGKAEVLDSEEGRQKIPLDCRSAVQFKFQVSKKSIGAAVHLQNARVAKATLAVKNDNVEDDKKRRAEQILKESADNSLTRKKSLGAAVHLQNVGVVKTTLSIENDNVEDDKKWDAEQILKESVEDAQDLSHL